MTKNASSARYDVVVVGAGIIGLAVARELLVRNPRLKVIVLEREQDIASHQTSNNSGVIHAGVYYPPNSLKAELCVKGAQLLYEYCDQHAIRYERCGKLVVATTQSELSGLAELGRRATANGVGIRHIDANELQTLEPNAAGIAAIYSPSTGITDFGKVARKLASDLIATGGVMHTSSGVHKIKVHARGLQLHHAGGMTYARYAIFCAGAWSDRLAVACGANVDPRIIPFRGTYLRIRPASRKPLARSLIYPVPDPSLPFLGVHITRTIDGNILVGPTALLSLSRDLHRAWYVKPNDVFDTFAWPGTWRAIQRWWRSGVIEIRHSMLRDALTTTVKRYMPHLEPTDLEPAFAGIRAQAVTRNGRFVDDFVFSVTERALHVRNAPSPAATASLAIAQHVFRMTQQLFDLS